MPYIVCLEETHACQARLLADKLKEVDKNKKAMQLLAHIKLASFAVNLTEKKIPIMQTGELNLHLMEMHKNKITLPKELQLCLLRVRMFRVMESNVRDAFQNVMQHSVAGTFNALEPVLGHIDRITDHDMANFFSERIVGDKLFGHIQRGEKGAGGALELATEALLYLQELIKTERVKDKVAMAKLQHCTVVCKCLVAILNPVPGSHGATKADVEAILKDNLDKSSDLDLAANRETTALLRSALEDIPFYQKMITIFWSAAVAEISYGPRLANLVDSVVNKEAGCIDRALSDMVVLRSNLRKSATHDLEDLILTQLLDSVASLNNEEGNLAGSVKAMRETLALIDKAVNAAPRLKERLGAHRQKLVAAMQELDAEDRASTLREALLELTDLQIDELSAVTEPAKKVITAVDGAKGFRARDEIAALATTSAIVLMTIVETHMSDSTEPQEFECVCACMERLLLLSPAVSEMDDRLALWRAGMEMNQSAVAFRSLGQDAPSCMQTEYGEQMATEMRVKMSVWATEIAKYKDADGDATKDGAAADQVYAPVGDTVAAIVSDIFVWRCTRDEAAVANASLALQPVAGGSCDSARWKEGVSLSAPLSHLLDVAEKTLFTITTDIFKSGIDGLRAALEIYSNSVKHFCLDKAFTEPSAIKAARAILQLAIASRAEGKLMKLLQVASATPDEKKLKAAKKLINNQLAELAGDEVNACELHPTVNCEIAKIMSEK